MGKKDNPGSYRPVSLTLPRKITQQVFLEAVSGCVKEKGMIWNSLFTMGDSCLNNLVALCDEMTRSMDNRRAIVVVYHLD